MNQQESKTNDQQTSDQMSDEYLGLAGRTARFFIDSPLSLLFYVAMLGMGFIGLFMTPRQEDPQISVPMIDIFVQYPGAEAELVSKRAIQPLERILSEIPGVKHVYSASERGQGMVTVEFDVGEKMGPSLVKVNDKLDSNMDLIPPGVMPPLVKAKGIDDVPVVNLTLWSKDMDGDGLPDVDDGQLRMLAQDVLQNLKQLSGTGNGFVVGGRREQITVEVYPERLKGYGISLDQVAQTIRTANSEQKAGGVESGNTHLTVVTGAFLKSVDDISRLVVGIYNNVPVYVHDVAKVAQRPEDAAQLVTYTTGPAGTHAQPAMGVPAVTIAIAKKEGENGVTVADAILERVEGLKDEWIPTNVEVSVTRNYGVTAKEKVNELLLKLLKATFFVVILVWAAFGGLVSLKFIPGLLWGALRPSFVVALVIPVVLLFTVFAAWILGFTIDRVSLFALIFSIGILVDDAIVVVENIYRRWLEEGSTDKVTAIDAVREVGNPTILATFTVIAALLPMGFVSGMMGPYMFPIPALGSVAMLISLFAAFVFTPWMAISRFLRPSMSYLQRAEELEHKDAERLEGLYRRILTPLIESKFKRFLFKLVLWGSFIAACSMFYFTWVAVKMLPLDNKPEFAVVLDMPEGTALPVTANLAHKIATELREIPEVTALQVYAGTARPFDFNGMVRHYYLRNQPWQAEVQVQLLDKKERKKRHLRTSHEIAVQARDDLQDLIKETGAKIAVVEMPPGPPVLQSVVAEVHGPTPEIRRQVARELTAIFAQTESLRDVDNYLRDPYEYWRFNVDTEKAVRSGISVDTINRNLSMAMGSTPIGDVKQRVGHEPTNIIIQVPLAIRSEVTHLGDLPIQSMNGQILALRELGNFERIPEDDIIYHKDLRAVEYVVADVGGKLAAPVYGMIQVQQLLKDYRAPDGVEIKTHWIGPPKNDDVSSIEWTGEWTVTYETFRDMGAAFMVALVLIYMLVVWEFGNFRIPALIMAPIPLTLLGIIPAHAAFGAEFTATSMIGWIALAGIIVRNSILLVDFSVHEVQRGISVAEAVIRACKTRTRPIMITALALVAGSSVILSDPIFQGMAVSLASGVLVSTILTLIVIPLGCIEASKALCEVAAAGCPSEMTEEAPQSGVQATPTKPKKKARTPLLLLIWSKLVGAIILVFYIVRGIFLLIGQLFKRPKPKAKPTPPPTSPPKPPTAPNDGGSTGGHSNPPASSEGGSSTESGTSENKAEAPKSKVKLEVVAPAPAESPRVVQQPIAEKEKEVEPVRLVEPSPPPSVEIVSEEAVAAATIETEVAPVKKAELEVPAKAPPKKKVSRRGIRLKDTMDDRGNGLGLK